MSKKTTMLVVIDGLGESDEGEGNAISKANTPNLDRLLATCPNTELLASRRSCWLT